jgi:hypothetical protein
VRCDFASRYLERYDAPPSIAKLRTRARNPRTMCRELRPIPFESRRSSLARASAQDGRVVVRSEGPLASRSRPNSEHRQPLRTEAVTPHQYLA